MFSGAGLWFLLTSHSLPSTSSQSFMSTTAFGLGSKYFALYEVAGVGIQWHTFSQSPVEGDDFNLLLSMMMLVVDAIVYGVLTWYIEAVHPGTCGQRGMRASQTLQEPLCWGTPAHVSSSAGVSQVSQFRGQL